MNKIDNVDKKIYEKLHKFLCDEIETHYKNGELEDVISCLADITTSLYKNYITQLCTIIKFSDKTESEGKKYIIEKRLECLKKDLIKELV